MEIFLKNILSKPILKHSLFWVVVFLFYATSSIERFTSTQEVVVTYIFHVFLQVIMAYSILNFIVPDYKKHRSWIRILGFVLVLFFLINFLYVSGRMFFLEKAYPDCYQLFLKKNGHLTFTQRIFDIKIMLFHLPIFYLQPLFFLVALQFYEKQYKASRIKEEQKKNELKALKHQLNPHFLFNTLNNLYVLSMEKSDKAPEIIEKLSGILHYMLYGSDKKFVSIQKEIKLIENYLALEQIRYEDRVIVSFKNSIDKALMIAPLLLLTFIENAFKHGVSQELKMATVKIELSTNKEDILFKVFNTKPLSINKNKEEGEKSIGLTNVSQQLNLLYPNRHSLEIKETNQSFEVKLKLKKQANV